MNYQRIYDQLIARAKDRKIYEYSELHHITPRCIGGTDSPENLVRLTAREHFIAHALLFKIHKTSKLAHAWFSMLRSSPGQQRKFTSRQYEKAKRAHVEALKQQIGIKNPFFRKEHSAETKKKISDANTGRKRAPAVIEKWVEDVAKKKKSPVHRKKIGRPGLVTLKNVITGKSIRVDKHHLFEYDLSIWKNPAAIKQAKSTCLYCGVESINGNIKRWHNENCKYNPRREEAGI